MTDIVDDLREYDREVFSGGLMIRAADEIERLREALAEMLEALERDNDPAFAHLRIHARAALKGQP